MLNTTAIDAPQHQDRSSPRSMIADAARTERLARILAPTIYCPESRVEECLAEAKPAVSS